MLRASCGAGRVRYGYLRPLQSVAIHALQPESAMKFEVWSEGYITSGERDGATFHGVWDGETFADACQAWADTTTDPRKYFDRERLTYWGCRLFDNETDARKGYG